MKKKRLMIVVIAALILIAGGMWAYYDHMQVESSKSCLLLKNVEALTGNENSTGPVYSSARTQNECTQANGLWKMRLKIISSGVVTISKNKTIKLPFVGEISWWGKTGEVVAWCTYSCEDYNGDNCCPQDQQGVYVNGVKVG